MAVSWLLLPLILLLPFSDATPSLSSDSVPLLSFKASVSNDSSGVLSSWNRSSYHCLWYGVFCDSSSGRVVGIIVTGGSALVGTLPASIGNLSELRFLSITHSAFSGEIPPDIGRLESLRVIELQGNNFSGRIPEQISRVPSLRILNLSYNALSGSIPAGVFRLATVDLSNNQLSGGLRIDDSSGCKSLVHLKLSNNYLVDGIPPAIGNCRNLRTLLLDGNMFQGKIPADIGRLSHLVALDVSQNGLTDGIPSELSNCRNLSVCVLTNLANSPEPCGGEFNTFQGSVPHDVLLLPNLQIFWAPRANLRGTLPSNWSDSCLLRVLNVGQNYITGDLPENIVMCRGLTFLDLSSNDLQGHLPFGLGVSCMVYFNVSCNSLSGILPPFKNGSCNSSRLVSSTADLNFLEEEDIAITYSNIASIWRSLANSVNFIIDLDFSRNGFSGPIPSFSIGDHLLLQIAGKLPSFNLFLNDNMFNGSLPLVLHTDCNNLQNFSVNFSRNQISGAINSQTLLTCLNLVSFEAEGNQIGGPIPPEIGSLKMLQQLDLRGNQLSGTLPDQLGELKAMKWMLLGNNNLTGTIPAGLSQLTSLLVLDLSKNELEGSIPVGLSSAMGVETLLLDHNRLSGEIPPSFSNLSSLTQLNLSFNNLSGNIPPLKNQISCHFFEGNEFLHACTSRHPASLPAIFPIPLKVREMHNHGKMRSSIIAVSTSASVVICILVLITIVILVRKRKLNRLSILRKKVVVTFGNAPAELNYENVVATTGNFSISNLIGTGGFGSTYKAELSPGFFVAVKRLSMGRFQGIQQFDAEIRTLGRIRHPKLVTLLGYHVGDDEMFLVYNYLSGGNLDTFIHGRSGKNPHWPAIYKIAINVAQALTFLHYSCIPRIVHRDIKPSNILLDVELNAYLSDFGLARLLEVFETHATTDVAGTFGYVAPEYATTCRVTEKSDVYSFGVVLLEMVSGKKSLDPSFSEYGNGFNIVAWIRLLMSEDRLSEVFLRELWMTGPQEALLQLLGLASACTAESLSVRPSMKHVLDRLKQLQA